MKDCVIIGSGPAGMSAAIYGIRANLDLVVVEKDYEGTGQVAESSKIDNYLGIQEVSGYELGEQFRKHAKSLGTVFLDSEVTEIKKVADSYEVNCSNGTVLQTKTVIYAAGASHRHLNIEGEERLLGRGVSYCAICDGALYHNKSVAVIGGGDTALQEALYLSKICKKVILIHRRNTFRGAASLVSKVAQKENIEVWLNHLPAFIGGENKVESLTLSDGTVLNVDGVFIAAGMLPQTELVKDLVTLNSNGYIVAEESGETSLPGFFVAGDIRTKKLRQIITAVADGANAITSANEYVTRVAMD